MHEVRVVCYAYGNIVEGNDGVRYDRRPMTVVGVSNGANYEQLLSIICNRLNINRMTHQVKLFYRVAIGDVNVYYDVVPVKDDYDVQQMLGFTQGHSGSVAVYVEIHENELPVTTEANLGQDKNYGDLVESQVYESQLYPATQEVDNSQPQVINFAPSEPSKDANNDINVDDGTPFDGFNNENSGDGSNGGESWLQTLDKPHSSQKRNNWRHKLASTDVDAGGSSEPVPFFTKGVGSGYATSEVEQLTNDSDLSFSDGFKVGMWFKSKELLIQGVKMHHIINRHDYNVVESNKKVWLVKCVNSSKGCKWRLRACLKKHGGCFQITKFEGPHTCVNAIITKDHPQLDSTTISKFIITEVWNSPNVKVEDLQGAIYKQFGFTVPLKRIQEAKQKAFEHVYGRWNKSYAELPHLLNAIQEANLGTKVEWRCLETNNAGHVIFDKLFWAFGPCIKAFVHCRPVVSIDHTTILCGKFKHKLLIATTMDGANHIIPLAYALVDEEAEDTWGWFLKWLLVHVIKDRIDICLISDNHAGIKNVVKGSDGHGAVWPRGWTWRWCIQHIASNFNSKARSKKCKDLLKKAAMQVQPKKFQECYETAKQMSPWIQRYFRDLHQQMWTLAYDGGVRFGVETTNMDETYNTALKDVRNLPVAALVKKTFYNCNDIFNQQKKEATDALANGQVLTKYAADKVERWCKAASAHHVITFDYQAQIFKVQTALRPAMHGQRGNNYHMVELKACRCTCQKWDTYRIPCSHAMAAMGKIHMDYAAYIGHWYTWDNQMRVYGCSFLPCTGKANWTALDIPVWHPMTRQKRKYQRS